MKQLTLLIILFSINLSVNAESITVNIPRMLPVDGGNITMSTCPKDINVCPHHDYVEREVMVKSFKMAETEVTFEMYDECVQDGGCKTKLSSWAYKNRKVRAPCVEGEACNYPFDEHWGRELHPVINVSWLDAQKYIQWLNSLSIGKFRLPTSQEWEYAARAKLKTTYPWGDKVLYGATNCADCGSPWSGKNTLQVARFGPNQFGLFDMYGNVSELTSNCFPLRIKGSQECMTYIYRGAAFTWHAQHLAPNTALNSMRDNKRTHFVGFRLAQDISDDNK